MDKVNPSGRVVVVGAGNVGASIAYSLVNQEIPQEVQLIDINQDLAEAQVLDLSDAANFTHGVKVRVGTYEGLENGDIVVITCGAAQKEGQTRLDLLNSNAKIIKDVVSKIKATGKIVYIVMVTNPVDVLTYIAIKEAGFPEGMVFGSGTLLDSGRLRVLLSQKLDVSSSNIHAYILGEHGDSSFPVLSSANVAGIPLKNLIEINENFISNIAEDIRDKAYEIIQGKGATYYGIGAVVARICKAVIGNERKVVPLSVMLKGQYGYEDVTIGVPAMLGCHGAMIIGEIKLDDHEKEMLSNSVKVIKENIAEVTEMLP